jgi:hypothetical protein
MEFIERSERVFVSFEEFDYGSAFGKKLWEMHGHLRVFFYSSVFPDFSAKRVGLRGASWKTPPSRWDLKMFKREF